jgi:lipopolysaccharide export system ATP-binding protein
MPLLETTKLRKSYAGRLVVDDVSFGVGHAEIVGLLGRNGAGKTTSFRMTIGMLESDGGRVVLDDRDITTLPMYKRARLRMGYLSQEPSVFQRMTCEQNLLAILETQGISRADRRRRAAELLAQFGLNHKARQQARTCSGGERRKLEIARALVTNPRIILMDEPFSGVDPIAVEDLQAEIRRLADDGIAFLITDHNVQQTLRVCDRAYILDEGRIFAEGRPRELINNEMVRRVYLGSLFRGDEFDQPFRPGRPREPGAGRSDGGEGPHEGDSDEPDSRVDPDGGGPARARAERGVPPADPGDHVRAGGGGRLGQ